MSILSQTYTEFKNLKNLFKYIILLCFFFVLPNFSYANEPQTWLFLNSNFVKNESNEFSILTHTRYQDSDGITLYLIQPKYSVPISKSVWIAFNYSFFGIEDVTNNQVESELVNQHRLEFEIQPRIKINELWTLQGRNRIEYLTDENFHYISHRLRHRNIFLYEKYKDRFASLVFQYELFYDFLNDRVNQTRFVPLGFRFYYENSYSW